MTPPPPWVVHSNGQSPFLWRSSSAQLVLRCFPDTNIYPHQHPHTLYISSPLLRRVSTLLPDHLLCCSMVTAMVSISNSEYVWVCSFSKQCSSLQAKHKTWHVWYKQIQCYAALTIQLGIWLLLRLKEALLLLAGLHGCGLNLTACYSSFFARLPVFIFDFFF